MPIYSLPDVCISEVLSYINEKTLYECLYVNRYFCKFTIPLIWREPFIRFNHPKNKNNSLINTLLACLNEDEISSLIPCAINLNNNQSPLFEYGKFLRKFVHDSCVGHIKTWLGLSYDLSYDADEVHDCRVQKLVNVIFHMIMRQGSNLHEFDTVRQGEFFYMPKLSTFISYEPGITNLRSLKMSYSILDGEYESAIEFLNMVPKSCNGIVDCELHVRSSIDIIKSQPLKKLRLYSDDNVFHYDEYVHIQGIQEEDKKALYALEFRSRTLKELTFLCIDFQDMNLSFLSKLDHLERLKIINCRGYLTTKKLYLKELTLDYKLDCDCYYDELKITGAMINPFLSEELHKLEFKSIVTPEAIKAIGESCPNLKFLQISIPAAHFNSAILPICELSSLRTLEIESQNYEIFSESCLETLGDNLKFVECLSLNFMIGLPDLPSFKYFTDNCKANLKKLIIFINGRQNSRKDYLIHVSNYQKVHNSLKFLGIKGYDHVITDEELKIINQDFDVELNSWFDLNLD